MRHRTFRLRAALDAVSLESTKTLETLITCRRLPFMGLDVPLTRQYRNGLDEIPSGIQESKRREFAIGPLRLKWMCVRAEHREMVATVSRRRAKTLRLPRPTPERHLAEMSDDAP